jgi:hypothetical protein
MATLKVWKLDDPDTAGEAVRELEGLQKQGLIHLLDVTWTSCTGTSPNIATYLVRWPVVANSMAAKPQPVDPPRWPHNWRNTGPMLLAKLAHIKVVPCSWRVTSAFQLTPPIEAAVTAMRTWPMTGLLGVRGRRRPTAAGGRGGLFLQGGTQADSVTWSCHTEYEQRPQHSSAALISETK